MTHSAMNQEQFIRLTQSEAWATIDVLLRRLDEASFWDEAFLEAAKDAHKKSYIRRQIKQLKDAEGWPIFANVVQLDPISGDELHIYKQEQIFDRDDYMQVVSYHRDRASYHQQMAAGYELRAQKRYAMQIPMHLTIDVGAEIDHMQTSD